MKNIATYDPAMCCSTGVSRLERGMKAIEQMAPRNGTTLRNLAEILKALADETRLMVLTMLQDGEMCVCEIMDVLPLSQPAVSHHLKILRQAGLVTDRRQGKWIYYRIDPEALAAVGELLDSAVIEPVRRRQATGWDRPRRHPRCKNGAVESEINHD